MADSIHWCDSCKIWLYSNEPVNRETTVVRPYQLAKTVLAWVVGSAIGYFFGFMFLYPLVSGLILFVILSRVGLSPQKRTMLPAISVQFGQWVWFLAALIVLRSFMPIGPDVVLLGLLLLWLLFSPSVASISVLLLYQGVSLAINAISIALTHDSFSRKALLLHMILRVTAILLMIIGLTRLDSLSSEGPSSIGAQLPGDLPTTEMKEPTA